MNSACTRLGLTSTTSWPRSTITTARMSSRCAQSSGSRFTRAIVRRRPSAPEHPPTQSDQSFGEPNMKIVLAPLRYDALPEVTSLALRWIADFDPFGLYDFQTRG